MNEEEYYCLGTFGVGDSFFLFKNIRVFVAVVEGEIYVFKHEKRSWVMVTFMPRNYTFL